MRLRSQAGFALLELVIAGGILAAVTAGILIRAAAASDAAMANRIIEQMVATQEAIVMSFAGYADFAGLKDNWKMIAARLPKDMLVRDTAGNLVGLVNAAGGEVTFSSDTVVAFHLNGDERRHLCAAIASAVAMAFPAVMIVNRATGTSRTASTLNAISPSQVSEACDGEQGPYLISLHVQT